jgi:3'(2'), 5'-bisphosphate nucleotidase
MAYYEGGVTARAKADLSPVTDADEAAERLIIAALPALVPDIPVIAEEQAAAEGVPETGGRRFWLVDPLDGTKEFLKHNGEFTVNIALVEDGRPVLGIVYAPALGAIYYASHDGAFMESDGGPARPISTRRAPDDGIVIAVSRSHRSPATEDFLADYKVKGERSAGSSLKFCLVASGEVDLYPRMGRTMEWDTAAGHAVVAAAGGSVRTLDGGELRYGKPGFENPSFVVRGRDVSMR